MKIRLSFGIAAAVAGTAMLVAAGQVAAATFTDGGFEAPGMSDVANGNPGTLGVTNSTNGAWTINATSTTNLHDGLFFSLDPTGGVVGNASFDGSQYIAFNGAGTGAGGAISQAFDTLIGVTYSVEFSIAGGDFDDSSHQIIANVTGTGPSLGSLTQAATNDVWTTHSFSFTADSTTSTLTFTDDLQAGGASSDLLLDGVAVIPEPSTIILAAFGLLGLLASSRRRRR